MKTIRRRKASPRRPAARRKAGAAVRSLRKPHPKTRAAAKRAKLDLTRVFKADYVAPATPVVLETGPSRYLSILGEGAPGGAQFQSRISALYGLAFTLKMTRKQRQKQDYTVNRLEARYLNLGHEPMPPQDQWQWQLLIRTPDFITPEELATGVEALRQRGKEGDFALVTLETINEGTCVQMLHVGPYDREGDTVAKMSSFAASNGLTLSGPHHEIYISDPRRVAPEKLKTIIRVPAAKIPVEPTPPAEPVPPSAPTPPIPPL